LSKTPDEELEFLEFKLLAQHTYEKRDQSMDVILKLEEKLGEVVTKSSKLEERWISLTKLGRVYNRFQHHEGNHEMKEKVERNRKVAERGLATLSKFQKTLTLQLVNLKDSVYQKGTTTCDNPVPKDGMLTFKKNQLLYIVERHKSNLYVAETFDGQRGFITIAQFVINPVEAFESKRQSVMNSDYAMRDATEALDEVYQQERLDKLSKFFGASVDEVKDQRHSLEKIEVVETSRRGKKFKKDDKKNVQSLKWRVSQLAGKVQESENKFADSQRLLRESEERNTKLLDQLDNLQKQISQQQQLLLIHMRSKTPPLSSSAPYAPRPLLYRTPSARTPSTKKSTKSMFF